MFKAFGFPVLQQTTVPSTETGGCKEGARGCKEGAEWTREREEATMQGMPNSHSACFSQLPLCFFFSFDRRTRWMSTIGRHRHEQTGWFFLFYYEKAYTRTWTQNKETWTDTHPFFHLSCSLLNRRQEKDLAEFKRTGLKNEGKLMTMCRACTFPHCANCGEKSSTVVKTPGTWYSLLL